MFSRLMAVATLAATIPMQLRRVARSKDAAEK